MTTVANKRHVRLRSDDVYIGRPSKWGNKFTHLIPKPWQRGLVHVESRQEAVERYREWIKTQPKLLAALPELKDRRLVCFCKPLACHGDVLCELVNAL